jgi:hypothetical protein
VERRSPGSRPAGRGEGSGAGRGRGLALVLCALGLAIAGCPPWRSSRDACVVAVNQGFEAVARAARENLESCFRDAGGPLCRARSVAECAAADLQHRIAVARRLALAAEARACRPGAPPSFGYAGAAAASDAAVASAGALAQGLFGRNLDAARVSRSGSPAEAGCQQHVLESAGRCAAAFEADYTRCARSALAGGADDAFDLVACKGGDPTGAVARACGAQLGAAIAGPCAGLDPATLFPGCSGDLAACARGHARRSASLALNDADALCRNVLVGSLPEPTLLQCFEPPPPEPIQYRDVPLPADRVVRSVDWDADGAHLVLGFTAPGVSGTQLASVRPDGTDFRCLTCGSAIAGNLRPAQRLHDGRRLLVAGGNSPNPKWRILECMPSLDDCQNSELLPIELPVNPDPTAPTLQYRVPHVTWDDAWFIWSEVRLRGPGGNLSAMGRLERDADRYVVRDARVIAPAVRSLDLGTDPDVWKNFTQPFEAKDSPMRGGLDWVEAGTPDAGHYDDFAIDLTNGSVRRMTRYPDHNEGINFTRDEQWAVVASARTDDRVEFLGLLPRPPYIDWIAFSLHFVAIAGAPSDGLSPGGNPDERDCYLDPWLLDRWFARGDYIGQRLDRPADGWGSTAGGVAWSPDGTELALLDQRWKRLTPPGEPQPTRLRILEFPDRAPIAPAAVVPIVPTPEPTWAIPYADWFVPDTFGDTVIPGKVSGAATIHNAMPSALQGSIEVDYDHYSDDGASVLDGHERIEIPVSVLQGAVYDVDLALTGQHSGTMHGSVTYDFVNDVNTGRVTTELDGRVVSGPETCYEAGLIPVP